MKRCIQFEPPMKAARSFRIAAFDTETYGLDGGLALGQLFHEDWTLAQVFYGVAATLDCIFSQPLELLKNTIWYAHNAEYDWRYIIDELKARGYYIAYKERCAGKFYELAIYPRGVKPSKNNHITKFRDSMAVFPFGLAKFTKEFAPTYVKQDIGLGAGGVIFDPANPVHIEYAKNDVVGLVRALQNLDKLLFENFSIHIQATTSGTAYKAWLRTLEKGEEFYRQTAPLETWFRSCYYGGLVGCNAIYGYEYPLVKTFDINSSYPANMKLGVPKGRARYATIIHDGYPGFYYVEAVVPDNAVLPIVPWRSEGGQLAWQTGRFKTFMSSIEIEYCQSLGVTFEEVNGYYFPEGLCYPFDKFVGICEKLRVKYKGTPTEIVVKLMQNSLYGRFGMKAEGRKLVHDPDGQPDDYESVYDPRTNNTIPDLYYQIEKRDTEYMLPHWAAWITANARILIDQATEMAGRENVLYRDTDSVHMIGDADALAPMCGQEYGKLKREGDKTNYKLHCPKGYTYTDDKGKTQATAKGIPQSQIKYPERGTVETAEQFKERLAKRDQLVKDIHEGRRPAVPFHSSTSLSNYLLSGKMYVDRVRRMTDPNKVYGHVIDATGRFRPKKAESE